MAVGRTIKRRVMHQDRDLISRELDIKFHHPEPMIKPDLECGQRIFRGQTPRTAMRNPGGIRPDGLKCNIGGQTHREVPWRIHIRVKNGGLGGHKRRKNLYI